MQRRCNGGTTEVQRRYYGSATEVQRRCNGYAMEVQWICNGYAMEVQWIYATDMQPRCAICAAGRIGCRYQGERSGLWVDSLVCGWIREVGGMPERGVLTNLAANLARNLRMRPVMPGPRRIIADRAKTSSRWPTAVARLFSPSRLIRIAAFAIFTRDFRLAGQ